MLTFADLEGGMSPSAYSNWPFVINMANSIIGVSILALPFCFKECGLVLGLILLVSSAWLTDITCHLLVKAALATKKRSYEYLALHIFGVAGKFTVEMSIIGMLIGTCVAFYIIIGDLAPAILSKLFGFENSGGLRTFLLVAVTVFGALPLGMMRNLDRLSRVSAISLTFYAIFATHVLLSAFPNFWSGVWISKLSYWNTDGLFKCLPIFALSFSCHTQLFIMYEELPEPSVKRMSSIVRSAVSVCATAYILVGFFGYVAFYDHEISGDVLMNFRPTLFSEVIKLGFCCSTVISFPLVIFPCRASIYTLLFTQHQSMHKNVISAAYMPPIYFKLITFGIIAFTLTIGIIVPNVEFMLSITGATMGSLICFILPAVMTMTVTTVSQAKQKFRAQFILFVGVTILIASTYATLKTQEKLVQQESVVKLAKPIEHHDSDDVKQAEQQLKLSKDKTGVGEAKVDADNPNTAKNVSADVKEKDADKILQKPAENIVLPTKPPDQKLDIKIDDKRQEPPNPREPVELPDGTVKKNLNPNSPEKVDDKHQNTKDNSNKSEGKNLQDIAKEVGRKTLEHPQIKGGSQDVIFQQKPVNDGNAAEGAVAVVKTTVQSPLVKAELPQALPDKQLSAKINATAGVSEMDLKPLDSLHRQKPKTPEKQLPKVDSVEEAKGILVELRKQQEEQKRLISEQQKIVEELKRHEEQLHHADKEQVKQDVQAKPIPQQEHQLPAGVAQVPQNIKKKALVQDITPAENVNKVYGAQGSNKNEAVFVPNVLKNVQQTVAPVVNIRPPVLNAKPPAVNSPVKRMDV